MQMKSRERHRISGEDLKRCARPRWGEIDAITKPLFSVFAYASRPRGWGKLPAEFLERVAPAWPKTCPTERGGPIDSWAELISNNFSFANAVSDSA